MSRGLSLTPVCALVDLGCHRIWSHSNISTRERPRPWAYDLAHSNLSCGCIEPDRIKVRSVRCLQECAYIITSFAGFYCHAAVHIPTTWGGSSLIRVQLMSSRLRYKFNPLCSVRTNDPSLRLNAATLRYF